MAKMIPSTDPIDPPRRGRPRTDEPAPAPGAPVKSDRWTLPIEDGAIDWARMRPERREQLRKMVNAGAPDAPRAAAPGTVTPTEVAEVFAPLVTLLYRGLSVAVVARTATLLHCAPADAAGMALTDDEIQTLQGPTIKVIEKYGGAALTKYGPEVTLVLGLAGIYGGKFAAVQMALHQKPSVTAAVHESGQIAQEPRLHLARPEVADAQPRSL